MITLSKQFPLEDEYKKKTGITVNDVKKLREWLKAQPHLPEKYITDLDLILTYHSCDCSAEVSKQVLDLHFTMRTLFTGFFKDRTVDDKMLNSMKVTLPIPLETLSYGGDAMLLLRFLSSDPKQFVIADTVRSIIMLMDLWQYEEGTWPGFMLLVDLTDFGMGHITKVSTQLQSMQQYIHFVQDAMLVKLKGIHLINSPSYIDKLMMLIKPIMKKSLLEKFHIHTVGSKTFEKYFPLEALPEDIGGKYKNSKQLLDEMTEKFKANKQFFIEENVKRVTESLRPGKPKTISDIVGGIEGSFKKLEID